MTPFAPWKALVCTSVYPFCPRTSQIRRDTFPPRPAMRSATSLFVVFVPIVVMYSSLNLSTTYRRIREVFPTAPSPRISTFFLKYSGTRGRSIPAPRRPYNRCPVIPRVENLGRLPDPAQPAVVVLRDPRGGPGAPLHLREMVRASPG